MIVGTVRELKDHEYRVGLTPEGASALSPRHSVLVEHGAGEGSGFSDDDYRHSGATICETAAEVWSRAEMIVKVKEPQPAEVPFFRRDCILFTYLHLAANLRLYEQILDAGVVALQYEQVRDAAGGLPLLAPMSEVAGRMAAIVGSQLLMKPGRGKLPGGVPGAPAARVVVLGAGTVGLSAVRSLIGLGAQISIVSAGLETLRHAEREFDGRVSTRTVTPRALAEELRGADLAILAAHVAGHATPKVVTAEMVRSMGPGAVLVDVSIDQGGASETSRATTHSDPTYLAEGVIHYCVANMPGIVPFTSTVALTSATLPYVVTIADRGLAGAMAADAGLAVALVRRSDPPSR